MLPRTCAPLLCGYYETKAILATLSANGVCQGERPPMRDAWTKCDNDCKQTIQKGMADFGCCYTKVKLFDLFGYFHPSRDACARRLVASRAVARSSALPSVPTASVTLPRMHVYRNAPKASPVRCHSFAVHSSAYNLASRVTIACDCHSTGDRPARPVNCVRSSRVSPSLCSHAAAHRLDAHVPDALRARAKGLRRRR